MDIDARLNELHRLILKEQGRGLALQQALLPLLRIAMKNSPEELKLFLAAPASAPSKQPGFENLDAVAEGMRDAMNFLRSEAGENPA